MHLAGLSQRRKKKMHISGKRVMFGHIWPACTTYFHFRAFLLRDSLFLFSLFNICLISLYTSFNAASLHCVCVCVCRLQTCSTGTVDIGGGRQRHQSSALLVLHNSPRTLNLSSASWRLYQSPDPIIDSNHVRLLVLAYQLIENRPEDKVGR